MTQRSKFKYCLFISLFSTILICLTTFLRVIVTFDTYEKEEKVLLDLQSMKSDFKDSAEKDEIDLSDESAEDKAIPKDFAQILRKHELRHRDSIIMFENDSGTHPNLFSIGLLATLISIMIYNLINFHRFQRN